MNGLIRIDDRLIHGQVVVGWGSRINPDYIILSDDVVASDESESELYLLGVPFEFEGKVKTFSDTVSFIKENSNKKFIIVVKSPNSILNLIKYGLEIYQLNIGGMHSKEDKKEINHYVYMNQKEYNDLLELSKKGIKISIQDLPGERKFDMKYITDQWEKYEK
ncbi:MAG: PTS sugar transporter subunit IIB [Candidatus Delongbacteria bacterium]|jgi:mannose/fructose/N-acetylgalactosamine-specific phosphotransferase system component IIB|nr:PTS sugar transporter subunit IIB [Candidatus Delongbacteria bacterium]